VDVNWLGQQINQPNLRHLIRLFLSQEGINNSAYEFLPETPAPGEPLSFNQRITTFPSAVATFYSPSDICGTGGMRRERIHAAPSWRGGSARYDCVFVRSSELGGLPWDIAQTRLFFSFSIKGRLYPCALIHDFQVIGDQPDEDTGMWIVGRVLDVNGHPSGARVVPLDAIFRAAHLLPIFGHLKDPLSLAVSPGTSLDDFDNFYVNRYIDHHAFEITGLL
jgi:hypothetical protein